MQESQIHYVERKKTETKEYIVYDSVNERLELIPGDRHQKVIICGLGGGSEFIGVWGACAQGNFLGNRNVLYLDWVAVT